MSRHGQVKDVRTSEAGKQSSGLLFVLVLVGALVGVWWVSGYLQAYAPDAVAAAHVNLGTWVIGVPVALLVAACFRGGSR